MDRYRSYAPTGTQVHWQGEQLAAAGDPATLAGDLAAVADRAGVDALNLRIHVPGVAPTVARQQITALGEVLGVLRRSPRFAEPHNSLTTPRLVADPSAIGGAARIRSPE